MANSNGVIDVRGAPFQPCWGCGKIAGGREAHQYYGNFPRGVEHGDCAQRIRTILDRSIRALSALDTEMDKQTGETLMKALITTTARKLDNRNLNEIKDDQVIRSAVEIDGIIAAVKTFRAISNMDDSTWNLRLKEHKKIMQGPEVVRRKVTQEELRFFEKETNEVLAFIDHRQYQLKAAVSRLTGQMRSFVEAFQKDPSMAPYCKLEDVIAPFYYNSNGLSDLKDLFKGVEKRGSIRVLFLATISQDPVYSAIKHISVKHIALQPTTGDLQDAKLYWELVGCSLWDSEKRAVVLPPECLEWYNHWVDIEEIGRIVSKGEGSEKAPSRL